VFRFRLLKSGNALSRSFLIFEAISAPPMIKKTPPAKTGIYNTISAEPSKALTKPFDILYYSVQLENLSVCINTLALLGLYGAAH